MLKLYYNYVMMLANLIASAFALDGGGSGIFIEAALQYMLQMLILVKDIMILLLDVFTHMLMYISSLGKVLSEIIKGLCIAYNWILDYVISQYWCRYLRPIVIGVLTVIKALSFTSISVANSIQELKDKIGDGNAEACISYFQTQGRMKCPGSNDQSYNGSQFQPQAMASLCWSQVPPPF
jgi:hypothetical protein